MESSGILGGIFQNLKTKDSRSPYNYKGKQKSPWYPAYLHQKETVTER